jgi:anti-anti-sigma regulatory factor
MHIPAKYQAAWQFLRELEKETEARDEPRMWIDGHRLNKLRVLANLKTIRLKTRRVRVHAIQEYIALARTQIEHQIVVEATEKLLGAPTMNVNYFAQFTPTQRAAWSRAVYASAQSFRKTLGHV